MPKLQQLTILGATGTIGIQTLNVVAQHPDKFGVFVAVLHVQPFALTDVNTVQINQNITIAGVHHLSNRIRATGDGVS